MGTWNFKGGLIWTGNRFVCNNDFIINLIDKDDKIIQLNESNLLIPGLIDFHCHLWAPGADLGVADTDFLSSGVTACADAGTFGYDGWKVADRLWIKSPLQIVSWLSVLPEGITIHPNPAPTPPGMISLEKLNETLSAAGNRLMGLKIRLGQVDEATDRGLLKVARIAAEKAKARIMIHLSGTFLSMEEVAESLRAGDVLSHPYHGQQGNILDYGGKISASFKNAVERGILLDVAHGRKHFSWKVYKQAIAEGLKPDTISTDLIASSWKKKPVFDLCFVLSRFVGIGLTEDEVFASVFKTPAKLMNIEVDASKTLIVLEKEHSPVQYADAFGEVVTGNIQYIPKLIVNNNQAVVN